MKIRYRIFISNISLLAIGLLIANMIGQKWVDNYIGQNILDKILTVIAYGFFLYSMVFIILTIFSIIGYILLKRKKNKEWKVGFGISLIFNLIVLLLFFLLSYL